MTHDNKDPRRNESGCLDLTAYEAIRNVEASERFHKLMGCILRVCELAGFSVEERIVLKDKSTGRIWR